MAIYFRLDPKYSLKVMLAIGWQILKEEQEYRSNGYIVAG
jgi:hypothetical protein